MATDTKNTKVPLWQCWKWPLALQIILGLVLGALLGVVIGMSVLTAVKSGIPLSEALEQRWDMRLCRLIGGMFMDALKMLVVPLVVAAIVTSVAGIGRMAGFARMGGKTALYYACTSIIAILIGVTLSNLIAPGLTSDGKALLTIGDGAVFGAEAERIEKASDHKASDWLGVIRDLIPANIFKAAIDGALLGLVTFSIVFGLVLGRLENKSGHVLRDSIDGVYQVMIGITNLVLMVAPIGVFGLMATTIGEQYAQLAGDDRITDFISAIAAFAATVVIGLAVHMFVVMPLLLLFIARVSPRRHFKAMFPALLTAFSSASSAATLPLTIQRLENQAGVSNKVTSFTAPLGATVNMDGTALYECAAALFVAQCYGIHLGYGEQFSMVLLALLTSIGVAGVPAASLVAIVLILENAGVPTEGLALVLITDRVLDMCRTTINVFSDSVGAVIIAASEGEKPLSTEPEG